MRPDSIALADGGLETALVFHQDVELPCFAAFPLLDDDAGRAELRRYFEPFLEAARRGAMTFVLDTPTWRANPEWGARLGYGAGALAAVNARAVAFARELAAGHADVLVNGVVGPRGDGYVVGERMTAAGAAAYHEAQVAAFAGSGVDRVTAVTFTYPEEAIGLVQAAAAHRVPAVVSFTVETDGRLPDGTGLAAAIEKVDAATGGSAEFFMVNCAHPTHVAAGLERPLPRIGGLRVNASARSHEELDAMEELDEGDPAALARDCAALREALPGVELLGGCCGTDLRHVERIAAAWVATRAEPAAGV